MPLWRKAKSVNEKEILTVSPSALLNACTCLIIFFFSKTVQYLHVQILEKLEDVIPNL